MGEAEVIIGRIVNIILLQNTKQNININNGPQNNIQKIETLTSLKTGVRRENILLQ